MVLANNIWHEDEGITYMTGRCQHEDILWFSLLCLADPPCDNLILTPPPPPFTPSPNQYHHLTRSRLKRHPLTRLVVIAVWSSRTSLRAADPHIGEALSRTQ